MEFKQLQMPNGLTIIGQVSPSAASLAVGFFVRTGSRDETAALAGVSHFLEHMMFKGTDRRSPFDINQEFDRMGAIYNAFTSEENTVYWAVVLPEFQTALVDLLGDMMRPALRQEDFDIEKKVILEEIALKEDLPQYRLYEKLMAEHFGEHPLSHSVLGTADSIQALTREDMLAYFRSRYSPGNVTLAAAGNLDWDAFVAKAGRMCGHWERADAPRATPATSGTRRSTVIADAALVQQHVGMLSPAPSAQEESRYAAHVLAAVLGDATGSRLFYALVEPAIAEDASCGYEEFDGTGGFVTLIVADPARAAEALRIAREEYRRFVAEGPTEQELIAARNKIAFSVTHRCELPMGMLTLVGFDWVYRRRYRPLGEHIERILAVRGEEVRQMAKRFELGSPTMLSLGPKASLEA